MMEEEKDQRLFTILMLSVALAAIMLIMYLAAASYYGSTKLWEETTIELGEGLSSDPAFYIEGHPWTLSHSTVDLSAVDFKTPGNYKVKVDAPFDEREFLIKIRDTSAPVITANDPSKLVLASGKNYDLSVLGVSVNDISDTADLHYLHDGSEISGLAFPDPGTKEILVRSTDASHNRSEKKLKILVDTPPVLYGVHDQYVVKGSAVSDLDPAFAEDDVDGWLSDRIVVDAYDVDFDTPGTYDIGYSVTDDYGLETTAEAKVHVVATEAAAVSHWGEWPVGNEEMEDICDGGYFRYDPLTEPDRRWVLNNCDRCLVNLFYEDQAATSSGSAFIYRITPEYVYFVSVYHVTQFLEDKYLKLTFFDGTYINVIIDSIRLSAGNEASLFRIPTQSVPYHTLMRLREVYCDGKIYDELKEGDPLLEYSANFKGGAKERLVKDVRIISFELSDIQKRYVDEGSYFTATRKSQSGMSGTAVFDYRGRLAGICSKTIYPLENEEEAFKDGSDLILKIDTISDLMKRAEELE